MDISEGGHSGWLTFVLLGRGRCVCVCPCACVCLFICRPGVRAPRPLAPDVTTAGVWGLKIALCSQHREREEGRGRGGGPSGKRRGEVIEKNVSGVPGEGELTS